MESVWNVGWTRGHGCQPLASVLGDGVATAIRDDLGRACVNERIDLLVARRLTSFDLVPVVVPHSVELETVEIVTVAVSDGPHSPLAVAVADRLAAGLGVEWEIVTAYRSEPELTDALGRLERMADGHPTAKQEAIETPDASALTDRLTPSSLLVLGAAGGSWLQRQFFGPGHRMTVTAPGGAVAVRSAPRRVFHALDDRHGAVVGSHMPATEALRIFNLPAIPVAEAGQLIGIVRAVNLVDADASITVADLMDPPVSIDVGAPVSAAQDLAHHLGGGPVPVTGSDGRLLGVMDVADGHATDLTEL